MCVCVCVSQVAGPSSDERAPDVPACNTLFYGVVGQQLQESDAASYYNPIEAVVVADLVTSLLSAAVKVWVWVWVWVCVCACVCVRLWG